MRAIISLPDDVFRAAEGHARRAKKSRGQLYSEAISEYLARHARHGPDEITKAVNRVIDQQVRRHGDCPRGRKFPPFEVRGPKSEALN